MSIAEAARELRVSRATIYKMIEDGRLETITTDRPYLKIGNRKVRKTSVERLKAGG